MIGLGTEEGKHEGQLITDSCPIPDPQSPILNNVRLSVVDLQSQTDPDFR
ncbi:hypothetical protein NIES4106_21780 [Fischerella sp. NIES-4106]|nr:hypothetical protein NIES4106_21780 [Fischerella sp. NIES-4106]